MYLDESEDIELLKKNAWVWTREQSFTPHCILYDLNVEFMSGCGT
jgi:hypothetical protein